VDSEATVAEPGIAGGVDAESDEEYLARVLAHLRNPARYGRPGDFAAWARDASPEVSAAWEFPNFSALGTVLVQAIMGIGPASELRYETAVRKLFPKGAYWDGQLSDPESDASLFARAKAAGLFRFRGRMTDLYREGWIETALETLGDWERVLLGAPNPGLGAGAGTSSRPT